MSFDLVKEIYYFLLNNTFSTKASLNQKYNINRILNNKLSRSDDNFFIKNKGNCYLVYLMIVSIQIVILSILHNKLNT